MFDNERNLVSAFKINHPPVRGQMLIETTPQNVMVINNEIRTWPWQDIKKIVVEMSPIPGYSGRVLVFYVGIYINAIFSNAREGTKIKVVKPLDWQKLLIPVYKRDKENVKELSKRHAYENNPNYTKRHKLLEDDDIADAVNMGSCYEELPKWHIKEKWQNDWSKKGRK